MGSGAALRPCVSFKKPNANQRQLLRAFFASGTCQVMLEPLLHRTVSTARSPGPPPPPPLLRTNPTAMTTPTNSTAMSTTFCNFHNKIYALSSSNYCISNTIIHVCLRHRRICGRHGQCHEKLPLAVQNTRAHTLTTSVRSCLCA